MNKFLYLICLAIVSVSCEGLLKSTPSGLLDESQMTDILVDMHITEATLRASNDSILRLNDTAQLKIRYAEVFRKHEISPEDFNMSLNFYIERIDILDNIYTDVITQLTELEASYQEQVNKQSLTDPKNKNINSLTNPWYRTIYIGEIKTQYFDSIPNP